MPRVLTFYVPPGKPVLRGHDHYWQVIRDLHRGPEAWSVADIRRRCGEGADRSSIRDFVQRLVAGGFAREADGVEGPPRYRLLKAPIATPCLRRDGSAGLQGRGQAAMWNVMRGPLGQNGFTAAEVALWASTDKVVVKLASAKSYIKHLNSAGYFVCLRKGGPRVPAAYRLKPALAEPLPPLVLRSQMVFDQNRGEIVGPVEAREVEP